MKHAPFSQKELDKEQAMDDCIKYGTPTLGVKHGIPRYGPLAVTESLLPVPDLHECNFCKCLTNAKQRICCEAGKVADKEKDND